MKTAATALLVVGAISVAVGLQFVYATSDAAYLGGHLVTAGVMIAWPV